MGIHRSEALRYRLNELYYGKSRASVRFRIGYIIVDLAIIAFFVAAPMIQKTPFFLIVDYAIAALLAADMAARIYASGDFRRLVRTPILWVDMLVLLTLLFPQYLFNFGFLRVLRLWTLVHSDIFWRAVWRGRYDDTYVEDVTRAAVTLITFIFVVTGFVYTSFVGEEGLDGYVDALYFTITTLTTTGYGDITLPGAWGKLLSIATMLAGITLFLRLGQTVVRPRKIRFPCPTCGLQRHDVDAVHCKACGEQLNIPNDDE
jgi:voltage-gated potassium channel